MIWPKSRLRAHEHSRNPSLVCRECNECSTAVFESDREERKIVLSPFAYGHSGSGRWEFKDIGISKEEKQTRALVGKEENESETISFFPSDCCLVWTLGNFCLYGHMAGNIIFSRYDMKFTLLWTSKEGGRGSCCTFTGLLVTPLIIVATRLETTSIFLRLLIRRLCLCEKPSLHRTSLAVDVRSDLL